MLVDTFYREDGDIIEAENRVAYEGDVNSYEVKTGKLKIKPAQVGNMKLYVTNTNNFIEATITINNYSDDSWVLFGSSTSLTGYRIGKWKSSSFQVQTLLNGSVTNSVNLDNTKFGLNFKLDFKITEGHVVILSDNEIVFDQDLEILGGIFGIGSTSNNTEYSNLLIKRVV